MLSWLEIAIYAIKLATELENGVHFIYIYRNIEITPAQCGHTNENTNKVLRA